MGRPDESPGRFREAALETYRSPERLDRAARVDDAKGWIGVSVGLVVVAAALAWGFWGGIPTQVVMSGEMVRVGAFREVAADQGGTVTRIAVVPGDQVEAGDLVATLDTGQIRTRSKGTVQGLSVAIGDEIVTGRSIASLVDESSEQTLSAVSYVSSADAVELRSKPNALVRPATVDRSKYGSLVGRISFVADVPASLEEVTATLQSEALARSLMAKSGGVAYLVRITFATPPAWTNDQTPPFEITDGTPAEIIATVGVERPIDLLFGG